MPKRSMWRGAQFDTLRLRLIKIATRVVEMKTMIRVHLPTSCPVTAIQKRTPSAASFNIWALRFSAARSPASKAGMSVFTTPATPSTRGKESATSRTPWHSGVARKQVQPALPRPLVGPSRKHDDSCAVEIGRLSGANAKGIRKRRSVQNVAGLCDRQICITVDEHELRPTRRIIMA